MKHMLDKPLKKKQSCEGDKLEDFERAVEWTKKKFLSHRKGEMIQEGKQAKKQMRWAEEKWVETCVNSWNRNTLEGHKWDPTEILVTRSCEMLGSSQEPSLISQKDSSRDVRGILLEMWREYNWGKMIVTHETGWIVIEFLCLSLSLKTFFAFPEVHFNINWRAISVYLRVAFSLLSEFTVSSLARE